MIDDLPVPSAQDIEEAVRFFQKRYGLTPKEKKARDDQLWQLEWMLQDIRMGDRVRDQIRRDRYK